MRKNIFLDTKLDCHAELVEASTIETLRQAPLDSAKFIQKNLAVVVSFFFATFFYVDKC